MKKMIIILILIFKISLLGYGQNSSVYNLFQSDEDFRTHRDNYYYFASKYLKINDRRKVSQMYRKEVNIYCFDEFKIKFEVDLATAFLSGISDIAHIRDALHAPLVIVGKIKEIEYDTNRNHSYHTSYKIEVNMNIRSRGIDLADSSVINLKTKNGKIGDRYVSTLSHDNIRFSVGDSLLLFAHPAIDLIEAQIGHLVRNEKMKSMAKESIQKSRHIDINDNSVFLLRSRYLIRNGRVIIDRSKSMPFNEVIDDLLNVQRINNYSEFKEVKSFRK